MATLAQVMLHLARRLHADIWNGSASGGTTTTVQDADCPEPNGWFNGGVLWLLSGANAGTTREVEGWSDVTRTLHFTPALAAPVAAGTLFAVSDVRFSRGALVAAVNQALLEIGLVEQVDESLTGAADAREYPLPEGVTDVRRVLVDDVVNLNWSVQAGTLIFDEGHAPAEDAAIRLYHVAEHAQVAADGDIVSPTIPPDRVIWTAAYYAALARAARAGSDDLQAQQLVKETDQKRLEARVKFPLRLRPRDPHLGRW